MDISPFLIYPSKCALPKNQKHKKLYLNKWHNTILKRTVNVLRQLPKLKHIEVVLEAITIFHYRRARALEYLSRLERITSVYLYDFENLKLYGKTHFNTTSMMRDSKEREDCSSQLTQIVCSLKRLESLEVDDSVLIHCKQLDFLDEVKNVTLCGVDVQTLTRLPNPPATVSSVLVNATDGFTLDTFTQPNRLVCLNLIFPHCEENLKRLSRSHVAKFLQVLNIDENWWDSEWRAIPNEAFDKFEQLECLSMRSCCFDGALLGEKLPNLKALRIEFCTVLDGIATFVSQFRELELLCWQSVLNPDYLLPIKEDLEHLSLPWEKMTSLNLRSLSVVPVLDDSELIFISRIGKMAICRCDCLVQEGCTLFWATWGLVSLGFGPERGLFLWF